MTIQEMQNELNTIYHKYFTNSKIIISKDCLGLTYSISLFLHNDISECASNIWQNDLMHITFYLSNNGNDFDNINDALPDNLLLECWSKAYATKPTNQYCCYGTRQLSFRKTSGNANKIVQTLERFIQKLHKSLCDDIDSDNITSDYIDLLKSKIIR